MSRSLWFGCDLVRAFQDWHAERRLERKLTAAAFDEWVQTVMTQDDSSRPSSKRNGWFISSCFRFPFF
jgi:hypothetical protein